MLPPLLFHIMLEVLSSGIGQEKLALLKTEEKEIKLPLFADDIIVYTENPGLLKTKNKNKNHTKTRLKPFQHSLRIQNKLTRIKYVSYPINKCVVTTILNIL